MPAKTQTLEEVFVEEIRDLYDAEKQIVKNLPKMAKAAKSGELKAAFQEHLEVTKGQVGRLEQIFEMLDQKARSKPCKGMKGLLEEGQEIITEGSKTSPALLDLELIGAAQKVEHYEISGYGTVRTFAQQLGNREIAQLLDQTLKEEEQTDKKLTQIAKTLYKEAVRQQGESSDEENGARAKSRSARSSGNGSSRTGKSASAGRGSSASNSEVDEQDLELEMEEE
jgi:ferritin-like metal-binding protein YciE